MIVTHPIHTPTKIAVLLLNYNGLKYLPLFFKHAEFLRNHPEAELILIDNASIDDSLLWMRDHAPWVQVIRNDENYGFSEGYNHGIAKLQNSAEQYSHYMFLNNDVIVSPEWLAEIISAIKNSDFRVAEFGCRSVFMAPYVKEFILECHSKDFSRLRCDFSTYPSSSKATLDKRAKTLEVAAKIRNELPLGFIDDPLGGDTAGYYQLELSTNSLSPLELKLAQGFTGKIDKSQEFTTEITVWKSSSQPSETTIKLSPGRLLVFRRLISKKELTDLPPLIQNSGIGINSAMEGFDLHCFEPVSAPQNHRATRGICGVCKTVRRDVFHELGGFDRNIFMYYEDLDLSLRLQRKGYKSQMVDKAILIHDHSGTSNNHSAFFTRQVAWSLLYFHWRHGSIFRRIKTWLRYFWLAHGEKSACLNPLGRHHEHALAKFKAIAKSNFLLRGEV